MASTARIAANRLNALNSTGPRTPAGKAVVSRNAVKTGMYAAKHLVVTALGETAADYHQFAADVIASLAPVGPVEVAVADRIAGLLWRVGRIGRLEAAASIPLAAALPQHPDSIAPAEPFNCLPPPSTAPAAVRLAFARHRLRSAGYNRDIAQKAVRLLDAPADDPAGNEPVSYSVADVITAVAGELLGWSREAIPCPWSRVAAAVGVATSPDRPPEWTAVTLKNGLDHAGSGSGWAADALRRAVLPVLRTQVQEWADRQTEWQREEAKLANELLADWNRAAAAAVFTESGPLAMVHKAEGHTSRELQRALSLFEQLQARRRDATVAARPDVLGFRLAGGLPPRVPTDVGFVLAGGRSGDRPRVVAGLG